MKKIIITGAAGLIGSEATLQFTRLGYQVHGVDNNLREYFFGTTGSTKNRLHFLKENCGSLFYHHDFDIRDRQRIDDLFKSVKPDAVIHAAAQPSHDWAKKEPFVDFSVNAVATLNLLEAAKAYAPEAPFVYLSTNKVYGDLPNTLPFIELESRWELPRSHQQFRGLDESLSIDQSNHSLFGVSKLSADLLVQEYGRAFGLPTVCFRGGCLTGAGQSGVELHGFLNYLVRCHIENRPYTVYGYKGKQVRDNIASGDLVSALMHFIATPKSGKVYNIGGGRKNNISMLEAIQKIRKISGFKTEIQFSDQARFGDHIWYISDLSRFESDYPGWKQEFSIDDILSHIVKSYQAPQHTKPGQSFFA